MNMAVDKYLLTTTLKMLHEFFFKVTIFSTWKPFKNDEKCFLFHLEALFVLKIFKYLSSLCSHPEKITALLTNNYNIHIAQYLKK